MSEIAVAPPFGRFERTLAGRYLRAKRKHGGVAMISIISFIAIALSVMVLIVTMSVMNGFRETLLSRILGLEGHVLINARGLPPEEVERYTKIAVETPGVRTAAPVIKSEALARSDRQTTGVIVVGIGRRDLQMMGLVANSVQPASAFDYFDGVEQPELILGSRVAQALGAFEGTGITILAPDMAATPFGQMPRQKSFRIGGTFSSGMADYDSRFVFMPLEQAKILFDRDDKVDEIELRVEDPDATDAVMAALRERLPSNAQVMDWRDKNRSLVGALMVERDVMRLILMMIVAIAVLNIVTGLIMLVKNKSRDIAILRTMGATKGAIMRIFFMASATIGVLGLALGVTMGVLFCVYIGEIQDFVQATTGFDLFPGTVYSLEKLPAKVEPGEVIFIGAFTIAVTFVSTLITAWWGSRLDPVEALRYE